MSYHTHFDSSTFLISAILTMIGVTKSACLPIEVVWEGSVLLERSLWGGRVFLKGVECLL